MGKDGVGGFSDAGVKQPKGTWEFLLLNISLFSFSIAKKIYKQTLNLGVKIKVTSLSLNALF